MIKSFKKFSELRQDSGSLNEYIVENNELVLEGEVIMSMSLNEIYTCKEINGNPVTLLGTENLVATFQDIDGNEIEVDVDCETDAWKVLRRREKLDHLKYRVN